MRAGGFIFALFLAVGVAWGASSLVSKATDQLRSHYATQTGDVETALMLGGRAKSDGFHNHSLLPVLAQVRGGSV